MNCLFLIEMIVSFIVLVILFEGILNWCCEYSYVIVLFFVLIIVDIVGICFLSSWVELLVMILEVWLDISFSLFVNGNVSVVVMILVNR